jgi:ligand-binding sensor domain-containing protein
MNCRVPEIGKILFLLALNIIFSAFSLSAQEHSYAHYDIKDGLASSTVYSMAQDKDGFIWFATESGLSRFDGTNFKNFTTSDGLPANEILKVFVDSKNRVWFLPFKKSIAYYQHGEFHNAENDSLLRRLKIDDGIIFFVEDKHGNILLGERNVIHIIDSAGKITKIGVFVAGMAGIFQCGLDSQQEFCIAGSSRSIFVVPVNGDTMVIFGVKEGRLVKERNTKSTWANSSLTFYLGAGLEIYIVKDSSILFDEKSAGFLLKIPKGYIGLSRINDSNVVLNTFTTTLLVNLRQQKIVDSFLHGQTVNSVLEDTEGNLWFSTLGRGVYRMGSPEVRNYFYKEGTNNLAIFSLGKFDSTLYFGGDHFLFGRMNLHTRQIQSKEIYSGMTRGRIMAIQKYDNKKVLLGTDLGLLMFEKFGNLPPPLIGIGSIKKLVLTQDSLLMVVQNLCTSRYDLKRSKFLDILWKRRTTAAICTRDGTYYFSDLEGLHRLGKDGKIDFLGTKNKDFTNLIAAFGESLDSTIWIATDGGGLIGYKNDKVIAHITTDDGLTSNICRSLFVGEKDIWVGTDKGLNKVIISGNGYRIIPYTISDGLSSDMINAIYVSNNEVFVGTSEGMTFFNENKISKRSECILRLTGISVSGKDWAADTTRFALPHSDNNIHVEFVGISYKSSGSILYRYRLLGLDTMWRYTKENELNYPSLPSGEYELQIIATNKFGVQSKQAAIKFKVEKLLWERLWFRLTALLAIAALLFLAFNFRLRRIRMKENERAETTQKIAELEQMALRSQMNPHFIFNCMNSIQQYVIYQDVLGANDFITKFSFLIRQTLNFSTRSTISLDEEISYITTYLELEKKRFENKFIYEIVVPDNVDRYRCHIPPMILQPYIENAIRHGIGLRPDNKGKITISMEFREGFLLCTVEDNGVGRKKAARYKSVNSIAYQSVGMTLVAKRVEMLNKINSSPVIINIEDLEDSSGEGSGTRIVLRFPLEVALNDHKR